LDGASNLLLVALGRFVLPSRGWEMTFVEWQMPAPSVILAVHRSLELLNWNQDGVGFRPGGEIPLADAQDQVQVNQVKRKNETNPHRYARLGFQTQRRRLVGHSGRIAPGPRALEGSHVLWIRALGRPRFSQDLP